jgi:hypothetical protein
MFRATLAGQVFPLARTEIRAPRTDPRHSASPPGLSFQNTNSYLTKN